MSGMQTNEDLGWVPDDKKKEIETKDEAIRTEQRRMWCLIQAIQLSLSVFQIDCEAELIPITLTAEEFNEFIETGVARTKVKVSRAKQ